MTGRWFQSLTVTVWGKNELNSTLKCTYFGNFEEGFVDVGVVFGAGLQRLDHVVLLGQGRGFLPPHLTQLVQVTLVACKITITDQTTNQYYYYY